MRILRVIIQNAWSFKKIFHQVKTVFPQWIKISSLSTMLKIALHTPTDENALSTWGAE